MITARFSSEMIEILRSVQDDIFCNYECGSVVSDEVYGNVRMNFGKSSVEIVNTVSELPFFDSTEDISGFTCESKSPTEKFQPYCDEPSEQHPINEKVISVYLVDDEISINDGEYEITFDMAVIVETAGHKYTFSRGWFFGETIQISVDMEFDEIYSVERVQEDWSDEGENRVRVRRSVRKL